VQLIADNEHGMRGGKGGGRGSIREAVQNIRALCSASTKIYCLLITLRSPGYGAIVPGDALRAAPPRFIGMNRRKIRQFGADYRWL